MKYSRDHSHGVSGVLHNMILRLHLVLNSQASGTPLCDYRKDNSEGNVVMKNLPPKHLFCKFAMYMI